MSQWRVRAYRHSALFEVTGRSMELPTRESVHVTREQALETVARLHDEPPEIAVSTDDMAVLLADATDMIERSGAHMLAVPRFGYRYVLTREADK